MVWVMIFHFIFLCFSCKDDLVFAPILSSFSVINLPPTSQRGLFREANFNVGVKFPWLLKDRFMSYILPDVTMISKLKGLVSMSVIICSKYFDPYMEDSHIHEKIPISYQTSGVNFWIAHRSPNIHGFWWCEQSKESWDSKGPTPPGCHPGGNEALILKDHENHHSWPLSLSLRLRRFLGPKFQGRHVAIGGWGPWDFRHQPTSFPATLSESIARALGTQREEIFGRCWCHMFFSKSSPLMEGGSSSLTA